MPNITNITPPRVPLTDARTGMITREWYLFFLSVFNLDDTLPRPELGTLAAVNQDNVGYLTFNNYPSPAPDARAGTMSWNDTGGLDIHMGVPGNHTGASNITQQIGEEIYVYGKASAAITDSPLQIIYKTGTVGSSGAITFAPTIAGLTDPGAIIGVATENIALNGFGRITAFGVVRGINTSGSAVGETWASGDDIWYNPLTGNPTKVKPIAPNMKTQIGTVINAGPGKSGSFQVLLLPGTILGGTDSNVQLSSPPTNKDLLQYDSALQYWKNVAPSSVAIGTATNLAGGLAGQIPYQTAPSTTSFSNLYWGQSTGYFGLNTTPAYPAHFLTTLTDTSTATNNSPNFYNIIQRNINFAITNAYGYWSNVTFTTALGTSTNAYGNFYQVFAELSSSGTINSLNGFLSRNGIYGTNPSGTITSNIAFLVDVTSYQGTGTYSVSIPISYGVRINNQANVTTGVTKGTSYGLYMADQTGATTTWAFYSLGGNSSHAGKFRFGDNSTPTEVLDVVGNATVSGTINKLTVTAPASGATLTLANGSTFATSGAFSVTLTATATTTLTLPTSGTIATTSNKLSDFAATTSAELRTVITDETGTGSLVFATSPTLVTPILGTPQSGDLSNCTNLPISTGLKGLTANGVAYATSTTALATGTVVTYDGTTFKVTGKGSYLDPSLANGGFNILASYSYNNGTANTIGSATYQNAHHIIYVSSTAGVTTIPIYSNGGSGVAFDYTYLDPDAGTWTRTTAGVTISFVQSGTGGNTFSIVISNSNGNGTIQRTAGSLAYSVYVQRLGAP